MKQAEVIKSIKIFENAIVVEKKYGQRNVKAFQRGEYQQNGIAFFNNEDVTSVTTIKYEDITKIESRLFNGVSVLVATINKNKMIVFSDSLENHFGIISNIA